MKDSFLKFKTIDIHNMFEKEALNFLKQEIIHHYKEGCLKIVVIHGYRKGNVLKQMVLSKLKMKNIRKIQPDLYNLGETVIWLK